MMGERPLPKLLGNIFEILHGYDGGDGGAIHQHPVTPWVLIMTVSPKQEVWNPLSLGSSTSKLTAPHSPIPRTATHSYALGLPFNTMLHSRPTTRKSHAIPITKYSLGLSNKVYLKVCFKLNYKVNPCISVEHTSVYLETHCPLL